MPQLQARHSVDYLWSLQKQTIITSKDRNQNELRKLIAVAHHNFFEYAAKQASVRLRVSFLASHVSAPHVSITPV
jgi:hypothetical protein